MRIESFNITADEAADKLNEYTASMRRRFTEQDRAVYQSYMELAAGLPVIDVNQAIANGGVFPETYTPKLGLARIDIKKIYFHHGWTQTQRVGRYSAWRLNATQDEMDIETAFAWSRCREETPEESSPHDTALSLGYRMELEPTVFAGIPDTVWKQRTIMNRQYETMVPPVPIQYRPNKDIDEYRILWEIEKWEPAQPPDDPLLLREIAHPVYVVVAQWDLTPLEQSILKAFATRER